MLTAMLGVGAIGLRGELAVGICVVDGGVRQSAKMPRVATLSRSGRLGHVWWLCGCVRALVRHFVAVLVVMGSIDCVAPAVSRLAAQCRFTLFIFKLVKLPTL